MKFQFFSILIFFCVSEGQAQCPKLVWSDEFDGTELDLSKWSYQLGDGCDINLCGWGNNELQWYSNSKDNVDVSKGTLKLKALRQTMQGKNYTSGRIRSMNKFDIKYGRFEARMKMPVGQGIWPAWWMMPTDNVYGGWPMSGELDIMEYLGHEPNKVHGTLHFGNPWPNNASTTKSYSLPLSTFANDYHDFAIEWKENEIRWFVDGYLYSTKRSQDLGGLRWPFDQKFHFIFNMAVGGNWPGNPNQSTVFPQSFEIDYVRVYDLVDRPRISGPDQVKQDAQDIYFELLNLPANTEIEWNVPPGVLIKSGQGKNLLKLDWGKTSGVIKARYKTMCEEKELKLEVNVTAALQRESSLENFDQTAKIRLTMNTGSFTDNFANPKPNTVNGTALCGKYIRNASAQYDVMVFDLDEIKNGSEFVTGKKKFYLDVLTNAPVGTQILLQLENKNTALSTNYPVGRHSRYTVNTTTSNDWERLTFEYLDRPSAAVSDGDINQLILLFATNSFTNHTYHFDNFDIYSSLLTALKGQPEGDFGLMVYPNPAKSTIYLKATSIHLVSSVSIFDMNGNYWYQQKHKQAPIPVSNLVPGIYFLQVDFKSGKRVYKKIVRS